MSVQGQRWSLASEKHNRTNKIQLLSAKESRPSGWRPNQKSQNKISIQTNILSERVSRRLWRLYFQTEKPAICFTIPSTTQMTNFIWIFIHHEM